MEFNINDKTKIRKITKWIIGVVTACILIYLAIRHLDMSAAGISWLVGIAFLVIPEIANTVRLVTRIVMTGID